MDSPSPAAIRYAFNLSTILLFVLVWLVAVILLRRRKNKSFVYLAFFTIFSIYLYKVIDYTILQFQSLLLLRHFMPGLMIRGSAVGDSINLVPLVTLTPDHLKTSLLNILMLVPFGFGLPFITPWKMSRVVLAGALFSLAIELLQLLTGYLSGVTFRIVDINDVLFNTLGAAIGYLLFAALIRLCRPWFPRWQLSPNPVLRHIATLRTPIPR